MKTQSGLLPLPARIDRKSRQSRLVSRCLRLLSPLIVFAIVGWLAAHPAQTLGSEPGAEAITQNQILNTQPTINGLFYGDGDNGRYQLYATSNFGSGLYTHFDVANGRLYVALVVSQSVNDMVCGNRAYTQSAGWNPPMPCDRKVDSEFAEFSLACAPGSPNNWTWRQRVGDPLNAAAPRSNWVSTVNCVSGDCAKFGVNGSGLGMQTATSWTANFNAYQSEFPYAAPWPPVGGLPWNVYVNGTAVGSWKTPFLASSPDNVTQVPGYPTHTTYNQMGAGFTASKGWEWSMVYEWSVDLGPDGANCGNEPIWLITGLSHHSPGKNGQENDPFPPVDPDNPPIMADLGDLPDIYRTKIASDGPRHYLTINGPRLGQIVYAEPDGQPGIDALGDGPEEDGVTAVGVQGGVLTIQVVVSNVPENGAALLGGWFDWNNDGDFTDPGDFASWELGPGTHTLTIPVGPGFNLGASPELYARFRIFSSGAAAPSKEAQLAQSDYYGVGTDGEVEDYRWSFKPTAVTLTHLTASSYTPIGTFMAVTLLATTIVFLSVGVVWQRRKAWRVD